MYLLDNIIKKICHVELTKIDSTIWQNNDLILKIISDQKTGQKMFDLVGTEFKFLSKIQRVQKIELLQDIFIDQQIYAKNQFIYLIWISRHNPDFRDEKSISNFLSWFKQNYNLELSVSAVSKIGVDTINKDIKKSSSKIYFTEIFQNIAEIVSELSKYSINSKITSKSLTKKGSKYIYNWK